MAPESHDEFRSLQPANAQPPGALELWITRLDGVKHWFESSFRIALCMWKGAYLLSERRRMLAQLGELTHAKAQRGEIKDPELDQVIHHLDRLNKKVEIEERVIRGLRFGARRPGPVDDTDGSEA